MKTIKIDTSFRNSITILFLFFLFFTIYLESEITPLIVILNLIFIYHHWINITEKIQFTKHNLVFNIRFFYKINILIIPLSEIVYTYKLEGGFRKSIMKLRIFYDNKQYEISTSSGWEEVEIDKFLKFLILNKVMEQV